MDTRDIKSLLQSDNSLYQSLASSWFSFHDPTVSHALANFDGIERSWATVAERAWTLKMPLKTLEDTRRIVHGLATSIPTLREQVSRINGVPRTIHEVLGNGVELLDKQTVLTGLTEGFTLTGTRHHVHDEHFSRMSLFRVRRDRLAALEASIRKLIDSGRLSDFTAAEQEASPVEESPFLLEGVRAVLVAFGHGMLTTSPDAFYAEPPAAWRHLQQVAKQGYEKTSFLLELCSDQQIVEEFHEAIPELDHLITSAKRSASDEVSLEGIFLVNKGVKRLRTTLERRSG